MSATPVIVKGITLTPRKNRSYGPYFLSAEELDVLRKRNVTIGTNCAINKTCQLDTFGKITIGDNVVLTSGVILLCHDACSIVWGVADKYGALTIGSNVFVGKNSILLRDVTVGDNVVIGCGSIVTKDVPNNVVVAGNPARVLKTIEEFLAQRIQDGAKHGRTHRDVGELFE